MNSFSFRTTISLEKSKTTIDHQSKTLCIGSCFAEHMATKMELSKFLTLLNPFGILYNPISISTALDQIIHNKYYQAADLVYHNGLYHSFNHHGKFSKHTKEDALSLINQSIEDSQQFLKTADFLILTLGTAFVFEKIEDQQIVANCHKFPNKAFKRYRLSVSEIYTTLAKTIQHLQYFNPKLKIIFSVSPVRHIRDGLLENQKSKASLLLAIDQLSKDFDLVQYFPSYEIVLDDLRDYRFYKEDLIHPNSQAIDYIWHQFQQYYFSDDTIDLIKKIGKMTKATQHKAFHPASEAHQQFLLKQLKQVILIEKQYPFLDFTKEKNIFRNALND